MRSVLVWLMMFFGGAIATATPANGQVGPCQPAELFVADNADPLFEMRADATITLNGIAVTGSTPLDGVHWSNARQQISYERSREFHVCGPGEPTLHDAALALSRQFTQESVLSFDYLPQAAPEADALLIAVPDVDIARFGDALVADPAARTRLRGGSVTAADHTLILVVGNDDRDVARRLIAETGASWDAATIAYGNREFVET